MDREDLYFIRKDMLGCDELDEDLNDKTLRFPKDKLDRLIDTLKDTYKNIHVETLPIDKLVKDNDLLNDDDLESYHERIWNNAKAKDFHIDKSKIDSISAIGIPFVTKKKDGRLLLSDGRHRTRAAYNDGYKFAEYPVYVEESLINEKIVKKGSKWQVQSEKGRNMGTYDTKKEAEKRLQQVHYFKHMNESNDEIITIVYTYQSPEVLKQLQDGKTYIADRKSTRLNSSHSGESRMPSSA